MLRLNQVKTLSVGLLLIVYLAGQPAHARLQLDAVLKTEFQEDPHANDGLSFRVLCYHDARDNLLDTFQTWPERGALATHDLIQQFEWLRENGYHMVSLDDILTARKGGPKLPSKAMLLTFDDGYLSMYTRIFPLLKLFNYPAVIGLVGEWLGDSGNGMVFYGDRWVSRKHFVTWPQVREMAASGLVEVASHSHKLHKGSRSNPQGSLPSSAITRIYNVSTKHYESDAEYLNRIRSDLAKNSALIERETGKKPRVMIWPYGAYNMLAVQASEAEGMPITMTLEPGANTPDHPLARMRRDMLFFHDKVSDLKRNLRQQERYDGEDQPITRIVALDLDTLYDPEPARQDKKLGDLIERIKRLRVNTVYLRAVSDLDQDGYADAAYFPNRHLPMRSDLFNRAAWQLRTRASVEPEALYVYAWLPIREFKPSGRAASHKVIKEIYEDAAKNAPRIGGLLLGDGKNPSRFLRVNQDTLSQELVAAFKIHQPYAFTALLIPSPSIFNDEGNPDIQRVFAENLKHYDYVTVLISDSKEDEGDAHDRLETITEKIARIPGAIKNTAFILPTITEGSSVSSEQLAARLRLLQQNGVRNFGYYPDQVTHNQPKLSVVHPVISLQTNPGR